MSVQEQREYLAGGVTGKGFRPGRSGNPNGRPKGISLTSKLRAAIQKPYPGDERPISDRLIDKLIGLALEGDLQAIKHIFERVDGKVPDKLEADVSHGGDALEVVGVILKALEPFPEAKLSVAQALREHIPPG